MNSIMNLKIDLKINEFNLKKIKLKYCFYNKRNIYTILFLKLIRLFLKLIKYILIVFQCISHMHNYKYYLFFYLLKL